MNMPSHSFSRVRRSVAALLAAGAVLLGSGGCVRTRVETSLATKVAAGDVNGEMDFWDALAARPVVCNDEALHGLILFADRADPTDGYGQRLDLARARGWVGRKWNEPGDLAVQRGTLARAVAVYCGIKGGVMMQVLGPRPRYANRELQYLGIMGGGSEQQAVSGREFMGILSKVQDYLLLKEAQKRLAEGNPEAEAAPEPDDIPAPRPADNPPTPNRARPGVEPSD